MKFEINTEGRPVLIKVYLEVQLPQRLAFTGIDPDPAHNNTIYFVRSKGINGREHLNKNNPIELPMPVTPDKLILDIAQENGSFGSAMRVEKVEVVPLPSTTVAFDRDVMEYYNFIKVLCQKVRYLKPGFYMSKDENFVIWLKDDLDGDKTPARVNRRTGMVKINLEEFLKFPVYIQIFILLHELIHYKFKTTDETRCDLGALKIYLGMMYPKSSANYAMTRVFDNSAESIRRVTILDNFIKNYDAQNGKMPPLRAA